MKVSVVGQSTLATAIAECCAVHFIVGRQPMLDADVLWLAYDTPLGDLDGHPDVAWVEEQCWRTIAMSRPRTIVLLSSQVPIGTTAKLQAAFPDYFIAYSPENIRVASGVDDFRQQSRIVVGRSSDSHDATFCTLLHPFTQNIIFTDPPTAEMVKHALNAFLGLQIAFINEIGRIAVHYGVSMADVTLALRSERRISPAAPLQVGGPFGKGHLARDIAVLSDLAGRLGAYAPIIQAIGPSNGGLHHK